jgi:uncharacterized damage-inducible protein DinB
MVGELEDPRRTEPGFELGEREMLEGWLEYHRVTLVLKCEGLSDQERKQRPVPSSKLSLHGLVRHMAEVEHGWFGKVLAKNRDAGNLVYDDDVEDSDFFPLDKAVWEDDLVMFHDACQRSRELAASRSLDDTGATRNGTPVSLRWIYTHMVEEYARHNGHADLIRELVDGAVGY